MHQSTTFGVLYMHSENFLLLYTYSTTFEGLYMYSTTFPLLYMYSNTKSLHKIDDFLVFSRTYKGRPPPCQKIRPSFFVSLQQGYCFMSQSNVASPCFLF
jgi:hypothetical protein